MSTSKTGQGRVALLGTAAVFFSIIVADVSDAGIGRSGIGFGRITQFASIFVNDREFDIATATITVDGQPATEADLKLGHTVVVTGTLDSELPIGVAEEVIATSAIEGPISTIDSEATQITVLGNIVFTDPDTVVERLSGDDVLEDFAVGDRVLISGFRRSDGPFLASRIEETGQGGDDRLEFVGAFDGKDEQAGEFEGFVSDFVSAAEFSVVGVRIVTNEGTGFVGGGPANLTADCNVTVRGTFDTTGKLVANEVTIRGTRIRLSGPVDASSDPSLTVLGVPLIANAGAQIRDKTDADVKPFGIAYISVGDYVETRSLKSPPSTTPVVVERIERLDAKDERLLQGFVSVLNAPLMRVQVLGKSVQVSSDTKFFDADDSEITATDFFNTSTLGTFVKIRGDGSSSANITASEISLKLDD